MLGQKKNGAMALYDHGAFIGSFYFKLNLLSPLALFFLLKTQTQKSRKKGKITHDKFTFYQVLI